MKSINRIDVIIELAKLGIADDADLIELEAWLDHQKYREREKKRRSYERKRERRKEAEQIIRDIVAGKYEK